MKYVYLHGFASGPGSGKAQFFRRKFREQGVDLIVPLLVPSEQFEQITLTGQLAVMEQIIGSEPAVLLGSSMGGYLASLYAASHVNVSKLVLMAPAFYFPHRWSEELGAARTAEWKRRGRMEVFHYGEGRLRQVGWNLVEDAQQYPPAPDFTQPALVFHGNYDSVVRPEFSIEFAKNRANIDLRLVDSDHQLTNVTSLMWDETKPFLFETA